MTGIVILVAALMGASAFGLYRRQVDGRFTAAPAVEVRGAQDRPVVEARGAQDRPVVEARGAQDRPVVEVRGAQDRPVVEVRGALATSLETTAADAPIWTTITAALPDAELGERATFVQFSSAFCAPCRTTRVLLADVAERETGVVHLEVDAEQHLDLVRALDVRRTPTTLILDHAGREIARAAGAPRREQVLAALPTMPAAVPIEAR